jgi:hypothetical protein
VDSYKTSGPSPIHVVAPFPIYVAAIGGVERCCLEAGQHLVISNGA